MRKVISFLAGLFLAGAILTASPSVAGIFPPALNDINGIPYNGPTATPGGELRVSILSQLFTETFDAGYDASQWTATTGGTGIAATSTVGNTILDGGTTLNSFSKFTSVPSFRPTQPGFLFFHVNLNLPSPVPSTAYTIFGLGTSPATPTIAAPVTNCVCWEVSTAGVLLPVTYASGTRLAIPFAAANQPKDALSHKYFVYFKGDIAFWAIDDKDNVVANFQTGASGPDVNNLPLLFQIVSNSGTHVTLQINGTTVGDTAHSTIGLSDSVYPWRRQTVYPSGSGFTGLVNTEGQRATYRYAVQAFAPVATPTAFAVIAGSATKVTRIKRITIGGVATATGNMQLQMSRWSTAGTLGSAVLTAVTAVKGDTNDAAATAVVSTVGTANYTTQGTGNATLLAAERITLATVATGATQALVYDFATRNDKPIILRGVTDILALSGAGSALPAGGVLDVEIETEEDTY